MDIILVIICQSKTKLEDEEENIVGGKNGNYPGFYLPIENLTSEDEDDIGGGTNGKYPGYYLPIRTLSSLEEDDVAGGKNGKNGNYPGYYLRSTVRACV